MPRLKDVKHIVERMKNMSPVITLGADKSGGFVLQVETDSASISTHFQNLQVWSCSQEQEDDKISVVIDVKKFYAFLSWDIVHPDSVKCNMLQERMVNLHLQVADYLKIQYFIPSVAT